MGWTVWGTELISTDLTSTAIYQPITFNDDIILRAVRTWVIVYNDPVFTDLSLKIYSNDAGLPKKLLATSTNVITKAEMITETNGVKEIYFEFNYPSFNGADTYHFVLNGTGYAPAGGSHLAWMKAFPDAVYQGGYTPALETIGVAPYQLYCIGAAL